jgi:pimeloyl-ACP methyl ester carboxylesterase
VREHDLLAGDGTRIRAWHAGSRGPVVLLCPGLGTMPEAWPVLLRDDPDDPGVRVHSWYHRGTLGSARPADESRITVEDHLMDAMAVLDHAQTDEPVVVMGWSAGVLVATELARRFPERVAGLLLVAGPPGDMFGGVFGALGLPEELSRPLAIGAAKLLRMAGPLVNAVLHTLPVNAVTATIVRHTGVMRPASPTGDVVRAGRRFLGHDWSWYARLALAMAEEPARDLTGLHCPITVLTGRYDVIVDPLHAMRPLGPLPQARIRMLPTSHFLPFEAPEELAEELRLLIARADAVRAAIRLADPVGAIRLADPVG